MSLRCIAVLTLFLIHIQLSMIATATHTHYNIQDKSRVLVAAYELSNIEPVCFATPDNGTTVYSSTTAIAAQQAVDAAGSGGTVKLAGICAGSELVNGTSQIIYTNQPISLAGGFTTTNWLASDPTVNNTVLDALKWSCNLCNTANNN